ncbi:MAG: hypothetical protein E4H13_08545 [Calditrichales bacterium]|nr:MAG: hypothetical protein E4H13_08545 [Calditrichales bacterium]
MEYTFHDLKKKKVVELREIAEGLGEEKVKGYTQLNKEHLLTALCEALNIEMHEHHEVVGVDKAAIKAQIREYKKKRDAAISEKNTEDLVRARRKIRNLKKTLRKAMV